MNEEQAKRLLNVAIALEDAAKHNALVDSFSMATWGYPTYDPDVDQTGDSRQEYMDNLLDFVENEISDDRDLDYVIESVVDVVEGRVIPHNCGAPACALGHYAIREDLQDDFKLTDAGTLLKHSRNLPKGQKASYYPDNPEYTSVQGITDPYLESHFGLTPFDVEDLFGAEGCGEAEDPIAAAIFIRNFLEANGYESTASRPK